MIFCVNAFSAIKTWDGGGADANWQTAANWVGDVAPVANDDLVFPSNAAQFTTSNNFFFQTNFNSISIDGSYTIGGNPLRIANSLTVQSGTQAINTAITISGGQIFTAAQGSVTTIAILSKSGLLNFDGAGSFGIGLISGSGPMSKQGIGAVLIASASSYIGAVTINNGIFIIDANMPNTPVTIITPPVTGGVLSLGGLGGTGTVGQVIISQGAISAGTLTSPTGILNTQDLIFGVDGAYACKIGGTTPGANGHDQLNAGGNVNLNNARLVPIPWNNFRPAINDTFVILKNDGTDAINGTFLNAPEGATFGGALNTAFRISYHGGDGNDVSITRVNKAPYDFDGDGKSDVSIFRPSTRDWWYRSSINGAQLATQWGSSTDLLAPADYDGDNKTDFAVFRPSDGNWYILNSGNQSVTTLHFGASGDMPLPNDFDGDGRADITVFRPSDGIWYEFRSLGNQVFIQQFGLNGDIPLQVDYDGDGIGDLAVFRPADGVWHFWQSSTSSYVAFPFGTTGDKPVPGDYDGDGRTDAAIFRATADPNQPDFYILLVGPLTFQGASWGVPGDTPVVADYDGDGKADVAVFRPGTNDWFLLRSTAGFSSVNFGQSGDKPVPAAYVP